MPDIFMPVDTSTSTKLFTNLIRKMVFNGYCIDYVLANKEKINSEYPDFATFNKKFVVDDAMIDDFRKVAESKEVTWDDEQYLRSEEWIKLRIKAMIAQDMWNIDKFYQVVMAEDKMVQKAVEILSSRKDYERILKE